MHMLIEHIYTRSMCQERSTVWPVTFFSRQLSPSAGHNASACHTPCALMPNFPSAAETVWLRILQLAVPWMRKNGNSRTSEEAAEWGVLSYVAIVWRSDCAKQLVRASALVWLWVHSGVSVFTRCSVLPFYRCLVGRGLPVWQKASAGCHARLTSFWKLDVEAPRQRKLGCIMKQLSNQWCVTENG